MKNTAARLVLGTLFLALCAAPARASNKVSSPDITAGLTELEYRGGIDFDESPRKNLQETDKFVVNHGFTDRWRLEAKLDDAGRRGTDVDTTYAELASRWQILKAGDSWLRLSVQENYKFALQEILPDKLEQAILAATDTGSLTHTVNIYFENELGAHARGGTDFNFGWKTLYNYDPRFSPGAETYVDFGKFGSSSRVSPDKYQAGPVIAGKFNGGFRYEAGWLFGANKAVPDGRLKLILTYGF